MAKPRTATAANSTALLAQYFAAKAEPAQIMDLYRQLRMDGTPEDAVTEVTRTLCAAQPDRRLWIEGMAGRKVTATSTRAPYSEAYRRKVENQQRAAMGLPPLEDDFADGVDLGDAGDPESHEGSAEGERELEHSEA